MRLHVFVAIPLIVSLFLLTCPAEAIPDASLLSLKPILEELTEARNSNIESRNEPIHLHGQYHVLEYVIRSLNISIIGTQSSSIISSRTENEQALSNSNPSSMLIVSNSTVALSSLRLICNGDHTSVASIYQSSLSVSNCKIGATSNTSPFLSTWTPTDNSILLVVDTQVNWKQATSLPLFGTMPSNHKSLATESSENSVLGREINQPRGLLSIVGSGLSFSNTVLPLATGPLFDFGIGLSDKIGDDERDESSSLDFRHCPLPSGVSTSDLFVDIGKHEPSLWNRVVGPEFWEFSLLSELVVLQKPNRPRPNRRPSHRVSPTQNNPIRPQTLFSTGFGLKLQGEDAILDFETMNEIDELIDESTGDALILDPPRLFFTTPSRPVLKSVGAITFSDSKQDTITIKLLGENLFANPYTLTVSDGSTTSTLTAEFDADGVNGETTAVLYSMDGSSKVELGFGKTYTITGFSSPGINQPKLTPNLQITVPSEPARVERVVSAALNDVQNEVEVTFQARALPPTITSVTFTGKDASVFISAKRLSDTSFSARFHVTVTASATSLFFGETYSIESASNGTSFVLNSGLSFRVPLKPQLIDINTTFSNDVKTGLDLVLTIDGSIRTSKYKLTMNDNIDVEVECLSSTLTCRTTTPIRIGWEVGIQYETEYTLSTMEEIGGFSHRVDLVENTFTTEAKPTQPVFHVDESGGVSDFCGDDGDRCKTIDEVWRIVKGIGFARPTLLILDSTTLDSPIIVSEGMHAMVTNESSTEPKLYVASFDLSEEQLGMIVVESAFLELRNVDVHVLSVSLSFVLIHGTNSELVFRDGLFAGPANGMTMNEDADGVCSWSSGALQLINCTTEITNTRLFRLSQGAINMMNGSLEIRSSSFDSNSASSSSFPSSRRNIHCSDDGKITIGSLSAGDGFQGSSLWVSMEDCVMDGDAAQPDSPLFVPQLDREQSMTVVNTATQQHTVSILGSRLIPCGLFLEVFEHESESNAEGKSVEFDLNHASSESEVTLVIEADEIAALDQKHELRCRLTFGQNQRTTAWFTFSAAHIDDPESPEPEPEKPKFSQTPHEKALSWVLPLVISVVLLLIILLVIFLVWRRKRQPKQEEKVELIEQENEEDVVKVEDLDSRIDETRNIVAVNQHKEETTNNFTKFGILSTAHEEVVEVLCLSDIDQKDIAETKFIASKETLYHRLHETQNPKPIEPQKIQKALTEQLLRVMQKVPTAQVLQNLNPHWVILGDESEVHFKLVNEQTKNQSLGDKLHNPNGGDAQRWNPPEESEQKIGSQQNRQVNTEAGLVFRLGLLLWEIETGQVPYREHDGLNAHRQIVLGVGLKMNGLENEGLRELIEDCMQIEAKKRPTLQKVNDRLVKCFSPSGSDPTLGQQNHKAESKQ